MAPDAKLRAKKIAIIGGGASGAIALLQLLDACAGELVEIEVFDPAEKLGAGIAYSSRDSSLLLNVDVKKMGYDPKHPGDFEQWLSESYPQAKSSSEYPFVPRYFYRDYLSARIEQRTEINWRHHRTEVASATYLTGKWRLIAKNGATSFCDHLLLCTGYERELSPDILRLTDLENVRKVLQPVSKDIETLSPTNEVILCGSALTAFDAWAMLRSRGHSGKITMISRCGLTPLAHEPKAAPVRISVMHGLSPVQVLRFVRGYQRAGNLPWGSVADEVRKQAGLIWSTWTDLERAQFLRHLHPYWQVIRHRLPPTSKARWMKECAEGKAQVLRGRIERTDFQDGKFRVTLADCNRVEADAVVLATGRKVAQNTVRICSRYSGLKVCSQGFGFSNVGAPQLWLVGPPSKATYWEVTAIPEIRFQIANLIRAIRAQPALIERPIFSQFKLHPTSSGESYFAHLKSAHKVVKFFLTHAGISLIHSVFPMYLHDKVSNDVRNLSKLMAVRRKKSVQHKDL